MNVIGWCIRILAIGIEAFGKSFVRTANLLRELLPALLTPEQLARQVQARYESIYTPAHASTWDELEDDSLEVWETDVLNRFRLNSGRVLAMGTGWGREALAIAQTGVTVVGVESNGVAVRRAQHRARQAGIPAHFHRADFTALPYADASFDFALLATTMYSGIPGTARRQAWLRGLGRLLKPGGLVLLSFERELPPRSRTRAISGPINALLHRLPGANRDYRPGDSYSAEHYMHMFHSEEEIREELGGAHVFIRELSWKRGYAVVSFSEPTKGS